MKKKSSLLLLHVCTLQQLDNGPCLITPPADGASLTNAKAGRETDNMDGTYIRPS